MTYDEKYITTIKVRKSKSFLYPFTGFIENTTFRPAATYLYWSEIEESIEDYNLLVYYKTDYSEIFKAFERGHILSNDKLVSCYEAEEGFVYVFSLAAYADDVAEFLEGRYSKISKIGKEVIMKYHGISDNKIASPGRPVYQALFPHLFREAVARELGFVEKSKYTGEEVIDYTYIPDELLDKWDRESETFTDKCIRDTCCIEKGDVYL